MNSNFVSGSELARLCGVSRQAVSTATKQGRLIRDENTKKYNLGNATNAAFYELSTVQNTEAESNPDTVNQGEEIRTMAAAKLAAEVRRIEAAALKIELANAVMKKDLVPGEIVGLFMGVYAAANRDWFFPIGRTVSRGDTALQERIDQAIFKACEKTREAAIKAVENEYIKIAQTMQEAKNANS